MQEDTACRRRDQVDPAKVLMSAAMPISDATDGTSGDGGEGGVDGNIVQVSRRPVVGSRSECIGADELEGIEGDAVTGGGGDRVARASGVLAISESAGHKEA